MHFVPQTQDLKTTEKTTVIGLTGLPSAKPQIVLDLLTPNQRSRRTQASQATNTLFYDQHGKKFQILPFSLVDGLSPEKTCSAILYTIDAERLKEGLREIPELKKIGSSIIIVLTQLEELLKKGIEIHLKKLEETLGLPVIGIGGFLNNNSFSFRIGLTKALNKSASKELPAHFDYHLVEKNCLKKPNKWLKKGILKLRSLSSHPFWGSLLFIGCLLSVLSGIFILSEYPMEWIRSITSILSQSVKTYLPEGPLNELLSEGILPGVGNVLAFLPQIALLVFFTGILESSGYMTRGAALLEKTLGKFGLPGQSFLPLVTSCGCAVPGILATRSIRSKRERLATIFAAPFMTCSARLPIFLLMAATLLPEERNHLGYKVLVVCTPYLLGTLAALLTALILRKTLLRGIGSIRTIILPPYQKPNIKNSFEQSKKQSYLFIKKAGTLILGFSIVVWFLMTHPNQSPDPKTRLEYSYAGKIGKTLEPVFEPIGFDWKTNVAVINAFLAREVFISTLAIAYETNDNESAISEKLPQKLQKAKAATGRPLFDLKTCLSIIVFFTFALQCFSTLAVVRKETESTLWPIGQFLWMFGVAYLGAYLTYNLTGWLIG